MKRLLKLMVVVFLCFAVHTAWADLEIGKVPKTVTLQDKLGGRLDGTPWNSEELKGKVSVIFYVDPDEKDMNNDTSEALKKENFPLEKYQSYGMINMAATWLPNFAISASIEEKQKKYANTIYIRDYKKTLVNEWGIGDDTSDVLAFDKAGNLIFRKYGKLTDEEIKTLVAAIRANLDK
ncbi:MAG: YtfJ family protein [Desulfatitalea sp.]